EKEGIAVRKDALDRRVIERELQTVHEEDKYNLMTLLMPHGFSTDERREQETLTTLFDLGRQVTAVLDLDDLLARIPELIGRLIAFDAFAVYLLEERRGELRVAYSRGYPES